MAAAADVHHSRVRGVAAALARCHLEPGPAHACSYLPGRSARYVAFSIATPFAGLYHAIMDLNYRRSGATFYRPACAGCQACRALRIPVSHFTPSRAQRRCWSRNADLEVTLGPAVPTEEKYALYLAYLRSRHDGQMDGSAGEFRQFLCVSGVETLEVSYRWQGRLVCAAIADVEPEAMSAVYCYFDPALRARSLGVYNVLWLIQACRRRGLPYLYLGYWVAGSRKMSYKARYRPHEILRGPGDWVRVGQDMGE